MKKCIKTGFNLYIDSDRTWMRVDLFFDGKDLFVNDNTLNYNRCPSIDVVCSGITTDHDDLHMLINPVVNKSIIDYVNDFQFMGPMEELFLKLYK